MPAISQDVADAAVAVIEGLGLSGLAAGGVRKRKRLALLDGEAPPLVFVAQGDGSTPVLLGRTSATTRRFLVRYPLSVAVAFQSQGKAAENATLREWAEAINRALLDWRAGFAANGLPGVNEVEAGGVAVFDPPAFDAKGIDWAVDTYTVEVGVDV